MKLSDGFFRAVCDYRYLLERDYPQKMMLKLVGDRYQMPSYERVILYRGMAKKTEIAKRQEKYSAILPPGVTISLDGFNVCRTIGSYLNGNPVFVGLDGYLRDVSELHRKKLKWEVLERAIDLIINYLKEKKAEFVRFYFDTPISHSGKMCEMTREKLNHHKMKGEAITVFSPDNALISVKSGLVCTSDSHIIEDAHVKVFDLSQHLMREKFSAKLFSLNDYLADKDCSSSL